MNVRNNKESPSENTTTQSKDIFKNRDAAINRVY